MSEQMAPSKPLSAPFDEETQLHTMIGVVCTRWQAVENRLASTFCVLVVPPNSMIDGALAAYLAIPTFSDRTKAIQRLFNEVFFSHSFDIDRSEIKSLLNKINKGSEIRNKFAHSIVLTEEKSAYIYPYYNHLDFERFKFYQDHGPKGSLKPRERWTFDEASKKADKALACLDDAKAIEDRLLKVIDRLDSSFADIPRQKFGVGIDPGAIKLEASLKSLRD